MKPSGYHPAAQQELQHAAQRMHEELWMAHDLAEVALPDAEAAPACYAHRLTARRSMPYALWFAGAPTAQILEEAAAVLRVGAERLTPPEFASLHGEMHWLAQTLAEHPYR